MTFHDSEAEQYEIIFNGETKRRKSCTEQLEAENPTQWLGELKVQAPEMF